MGVESLLKSLFLNTLMWSFEELQYFFLRNNMINVGGKISFAIVSTNENIDAYVYSIG